MVCKPTLRQQIRVAHRFEVLKGLPQGKPFLVQIELYIKFFYITVTLKRDAPFSLKISQLIIRIVVL